MDMDEFRARNIKRCTSPEGFNQPLHLWSAAEWLTAVVGELGEAANVLTKLLRCRDGIPGNEKTYSELRIDLGKELADTFIYLDLFAAAAGFVLSDLVEQKFQEVSERIGYVE